MIGAKVGIASDIFSLLGSVLYSNNSFASTPQILYTDNSVASVAEDFTHFEAGIEGEYKIKDYVGIGLEYKLTYQTISTSGIDDDINSLSLEFGSNIETVYLTVPLKYKLGSVILKSKIGYSIWMTNYPTANYTIRFWDYDKEKYNTSYEVKKSAHSFYFQIGANYSLFNTLPLDVSYEFKTKWVSDEYSEYWNSLIFTIPLGE